MEFTIDSIKEIAFSIYTWIGALALLFYKKAISDLEIASGYLIQGTISQSVLSVSAKKLRYIYFIIPMPILVKLISDKEFKLRESDFFEQEHKRVQQNDLPSLESLSQDFQAHSPSLYIEIISFEQKVPTITMSCNNLIIVPNVFLHFYSDQTRKFHTLVEIRAYRLGPMESGTSISSTDKVDFQIRWLGSERFIGKYLTKILDKVFVKDNLEHRSLFQKLTKCNQDKI